MFGWFAPKCPLGTSEKAWTEKRMRWLADQFGIERLLEARVVLPTEEYFPGPYNGDAKSAHRFFDRLCGYMKVPRDRVTLEIEADRAMPGAAGLYQQRKRSIITVARSKLADSTRLAATLAHELAHELLLGEGRLTRAVADHERITDLLPVFLGTGIFLANATVQESSGYQAGWSWWSISKLGYLPARIFGYAFALFAFARGEKDPPWAKHLRLDAQSAFRAGLRFLSKTGDSLFHPETVRTKWRAPTAAEAIERLHTGTPTVRFVTLEEITDQKLIGRDVQEAVQGCLADRDSDVRAAAARALTIFGPAAEEAIPQLLNALSYGTPVLQIAVAEALGGIGRRPEVVIPELTAILRDGLASGLPSCRTETVVPELTVLVPEEGSGVVNAAARALARFGPQAASAVPNVLAALEPPLVQCDYALLRCLFHTLRALSREARQEVQAYFASRDPNLGRLALEVFDEKR